MPAVMELSWSKIKRWRKCKASYAYRYVDRIVPKKKAVPLVRGSIIGECLDTATEMKLNPKKTELHWNSVLHKYADEYRVAMDEDPEKYGSLIDDSTSIISRYLKHWKDEELTYWAPPGGKPYEHKVEVELLPGVTFIGYIDKIAVDKRGRYWVMDHKSHKRMPEENDRFSDLQLVFYAWAAPLCGMPKPSGVIWDYLRTKLPSEPEVLKSGQLSKRKDIDTDEQTYLNAIHRNGLDPKDYEDILEIIRAKGNDSFFKRVQLPNPSRGLIKNVVDDAKITAQEIQYLAGKNRVRTMTPMCKGCEYFAICQVDIRGLDAEYVMESEYVQKEKIVDAHKEEIVEAD